MKILANIEFPLEPFNSMIRNGTIGATLGGILEAIKPEAAYFYSPNGCRGGTFIFNIDDVSQIPKIAEPFFLKFNAKFDYNLVMSPQDIAQAQLDDIGKKWS